MPTLASIRTAFRNGITANTANTQLLRRLRRAWTDPSDVATDLGVALAYINGNPAEITQEVFGQQLALIRSHLSEMPATGTGSVRTFRNSIRRLIVDVASPAWLVNQCEVIKRMTLIDTDVNGSPQFDQQATDPSVAAADAALIVIADANATPDQLIAASAAIDLWRERTPAQPVPETPE